MGGISYANVWGKAVVVYGVCVHVGLERWGFPYQGKLYACAEEVAGISCEHRLNCDDDAADVAQRYPCVDNSSPPLTFFLKTWVSNPRYIELISFYMCVVSLIDRRATNKNALRFIP